MFTFSGFVILIAVIVGAIAFIHYTQGFFTATISAILAIFSAILAISYHETVVESFLGGKMADSAHGAVVLIMFATIYLILRMTFDQLIPGGLAMPAMANKVGGAAMGLVAGVFAAGVVAFAGQSMSFNPALMGYSRVPVEEASAMVPRSGSSAGKQMKSHPLYDYLSQTNKPLHEVDSGEQLKMFIPADDVLIETVRRVSDNGALSASKPLASVHPDWLMELFGQRLGIEPAGRRVAINKDQQNDVIARGGKDSPHPDAGLYVMDRPFPQKAADFPQISKKNIPEEGAPPFEFRPGPQSIVVVHRVYFGGKAKDTRDSLIRLSMSSVRICTRRPSPTGEMEWFNYFPTATLEDVETVFLQRPDDYIFIDDSVGGQEEIGGGTVQDKAVDLIFVIDAPGFLEGDARPPLSKAPPDAWANFIKSARVSEGTFLEVKRMARVDLSGVPLQSISKLPKRLAVSVLRKEAIKPPAEIAIEKKRTINEAVTKLIGTWEGTLMIGDEGESAATMTFTKNGQVQGTLKALDEKGVTGAVAGTWAAKSAEGDSLVAAYKVSIGGKPPVDDMVTFQLGEDMVTLVDRNGTRSSGTLKRKGSASAQKPPAGTPDPGAPAPTPGTTTPPPPPAVPVDRSMKVAMDTLQENPKFIAAISVPAGSAGEVTVPGGTINIDGNQLKAVKLDAAEVDKLKGAGEPINRLNKAEGTVLMQVEAVPGPAAADGWAWKDKVEQIVAVDAKGTQHKCVGAWAVSADGKTITARFTAGAQVSMTDVTAPPAPPAKIFLAFEVPEGTEIKKIQVGQAPVMGS
jgi:hypothetical protein